MLNHMITFLILLFQLSVWTNKQQLYSTLERYDHQLTQLYKDMDSGNMDRFDEVFKNEVMVKQTSDQMWHQ